MNWTRRQFLHNASAAFGALAVGACASRKADESWAPTSRVFQSIVKPEVPAQTFNVRDYGANGKSLATEAFSLAIADCRAAGGGRILVPKGTFLTGAIQLYSNMELHLEEGAQLRFSTNPQDYPLVLSRYEGVELYNYSPLIYAHKARNVLLTGKGTLDGQAADENWWSWCGSPKFGWQPGMPRQTEDRERLFAMAEMGTPVAQRIFGLGHYLRPSFVEFYDCEDVYVEDVTLRDSPFWNIHPVLCRNVTVTGVTVTGHGPNNDGCNPESVNGMIIDHCFFDTGDDCIAIKSGRNADGRRVAVPTQNVWIRGCQMRAGHGGVVIGSEVSGDVFNVYVEDCTMDSPELWYALRIKNNAVRGGRVSGIYVRDVSVGQVKFAAITCDFNYEEGDKGDFVPELDNLFVTRMRVDNAVRVLDCQGLEQAPIARIELQDCSFRGVQLPSIVNHTQQLTLHNVWVNDQPTSRHTLL